MAHGLTLSTHGDEALRQSEERFRTIFTQSPIGIAMYDAAGILVEINPAARDIFGVIDSDQLLGRMTLAGNPYIDAEDLRRLRKGEAIQREISYDFEMIRQTGYYETTRSGIATMEAMIKPLCCGSGSAPHAFLLQVRDITERKKTEEALRESERRLQHYQEIAHLGGWELDLLKDKLTWSDEVFRIFGMSPCEFDGTCQAFLDLIHPEDQTAVHAAYANSLQEENVYEVEHRIVRKTTGEIRWVQERCQHIRDAGGQVIRSLGTVLDITERKAAEEALRESERRLNRSQEMAHLGSWELDLLKDELTWSDEIYRIFGLAPREFGATYEAFLDRVHPHDQIAVDYAYSASLRDGRDTYEIEHRVVRKSTGEVRWVQEKCQHERDAGGRIIRSLGMVLDITERKLAEEALARERAFLASAINILPIPFVFVDPAGKFLRANEASSHYFRGVEGHDLWDIHLHCPITQTAIPKADRPLMRALQGEVVAGYETTAEFPNGLRVPVLLHTAPVQVDGAIVAAVGVIQDISALKEADRAKDEFLAVLSHELQTPLTSILGWSAEALRLGTPEIMAQAMEIVHRNAYRQKRLIDEILDMSRLIHRKIELQPEPADLGAQARQAAENMQQAAAVRELTLVVNPPPAALPILADVTRLQQCIGNLLHNSMKFTPAGGTITVSCHRDEDETFLTVRDTGRGLTREALADLFRVFRQVERDERAGGLGLGLAITRGIVELHGGRIQADSPGRNQGSTFTITLPLADGKIDGISRKRPRRAQTGG